jgi:hypothetical protein
VKGNDPKIRDNGKSAVMITIIHKQEFDSFWNNVFEDLAV